MRARIPSKINSFCMHIFYLLHLTFQNSNENDFFFIEQKNYEII